MERATMESVIAARTRLESRTRAKLESVIPAAMAADSSYAASLGGRER